MFLKSGGNILTRKLFNLILIAAMMILLPSFIVAQQLETKEYAISANDLLEISVYEEPDLTKTVRVGADGTISYPLLGRIDVKGLTSKELETKITEMLAQDYLVNPQVSVFVKEHAKISVLGQVRSPGSYELKSNLTVIDAIVLAGGFTDKANAGDVKLVRQKGEGKETINLDASEIVEKGHKEKDITLKPGDLVIVGELSESTEFVVVLGQVKNPGRYGFKKGMTVIEAIALAGGPTETAAANGTKVIRRQNEKELTIKVPVDSILKGGQRNKNIPLRPGDTIVVPESFF